MIPAMRQNVNLICEAGYAVPQGEFDNKSLMFNRLCRGIDEPRYSETQAKDHALLGLESGYTGRCLQLYRQAFQKWRRFLENQQDIICFPGKKQYHTFSVQV